MERSLDDFVARFQDEILKQVKETYGDKVYERWQNPLYRGAIKDADGYARLKGRCEDTMEIFLKFQGNHVEKAAFQTDGCGSSIVCGSIAAEISFGKSPEDLLDISGEDILMKLGGLPKEDEHCAFLAAATLHEAINSYMIKQTKKLETG
jgi:nitrogen fixation NifU-like protein